MADVNSTLPRRSGGAAGGGKPSAAAREQEQHHELIAFVEMLFFAYRDFTGEPDAILDQFGFGRAHHRVLHFVNRWPGIRVADLLDILKITKQSLARVLKQLIDEGFVDSRTGPTDRRERHLELTTKGRDLADRLARLQTARFAAALDKAGPDARRVTRQVLAGMIATDDRVRIERLIDELQSRSASK